MRALEFFICVFIFATITYSRHDENKIVKRLEVKSEFRTKVGSEVWSKVGSEVKLEVGSDISQKSSQKLGQKLVRSCISSPKFKI